MINKLVIFLLVSILCSHFCQSEFVVPPKLENGAKFMQGVLNFCTNTHKTDISQIIKTYNYDDNNQNAKCAIMCVLQSAQIMDKNGDVGGADIRKVLEYLPDEEKRTKIENTLNECCQQGPGDPCEKAFRFTKCISKVKDMIPVDAIKSIMQNDAIKSMISSISPS